DAVSRPATGPGDRRPPRRLNRAALPPYLLGHAGGSDRPRARQSPPIPTPAGTSVCRGVFPDKTSRVIPPEVSRIPARDGRVGAEFTDMFDNSAVDAWWYPKSFRRGDQGGAAALSARRCGASDGVARLDD